MKTEQLKPFVEKAIEDTMDYIREHSGEDPYNGHDDFIEVNIKGNFVVFDITYEFEHYEKCDRAATHLEPAEYSIHGYFEVTSMEYWNEDEELVEVPSELWEGERSWE